MTQKIELRFSIISLMILLTALSRIIPHPPNFAPVGAMALFGATYFSNKFFALFVPITTMWLSDLVINNILYSQYFGGFVLFYPGFYWVYFSFFIISGLGYLFLKKVNLVALLFTSIMASFIFYIISNLGVWFSGTMYPKTAEGLTACYVAGIPYLKNTLSGNIFYSALLFGLFELIQFKVPKVRINNQGSSIN